MGPSQHGREKSQYGIIAPICPLLVRLDEGGLALDLGQLGIRCVAYNMRLVEEVRSCVHPIQLKKEGEA